MASNLLVYGPNAIDRWESVRFHVDELDPSTMSTSTFDARETQPEVIRGALYSPPFFGGFRVVVIRELFVRGTANDAQGTVSRSTWSDIRDDVGAIPESTAIVLDSSTTPDKRIREKLQQDGWTAESFPELRGNALLQWVTDRCRVNGAEIERAGATELLDRLYPTIWRNEPGRWDDQTVRTELLATEIEKLSVAAGDNAISTDLVATLVSRRSATTAFKLGDEVFAGNTSEALKELDQSLRSGGIPEQLLGQMAYTTASNIAAHDASRGGLKRVVDVSGFSAGLLQATIRHKGGWRNRRALAAATEELRRAEWLVKTGRAAQADNVLHFALGEIGETIRDSAKSGS